MRSTEYLTELMAGLSPAPFEYDREDGVFVIGKEEVSLRDFGTYIPSPRARLGNEQTADLIGRTPLLLGIFGSLYQTPMLYEWIKSQSDAELERTKSAITGVMMETHGRVSGDSSSYFRRGKSHIDFGVTLYRSGHPVLRTLGDCACLGVNPDAPLFGADTWDLGFSAYTEHNVDTTVQHASLYAGAGILARLCRLSTVPTLF